MIDRISSSPVFTSKVSMYYSHKPSLNEFYNSPVAKKQLDMIKKDGKDYFVTLHPISDGASMRVRVVKKENGVQMYDSRLARSPEEIVDAYKKALEDIERFKVEIPKDLPVKSYIL